MKDPLLQYDAQSLSGNRSFLVALFLATLIHILIGLSFSFRLPHPKINQSIDVTFINTPSPKAPDKAHTLAEEHQQGGGEIKQRQDAMNLPKQTSVQVNKEPGTREKLASEVKAVKSSQKLITQEKSDRKITAVNKMAKEQPVAAHPQLSAEMLQQQIAQLGTEIRLNQQNSEQAKVKFIDSVSAHKYVAAQYMKDWEEKVERTGNLNYPEIAAKKNFLGVLTMDVGIKADGSIYSIRINQSSGNPDLDEAAKKIVRMSAPFAPLPIELLKELDVLVITRVWKFADESGMTTQ